MKMGEARERLRQIYQQEEQGQKTLIPARPKRSLNKEDQFFRVCAYCRVSTDNEEQLSSYELQQAHYRKVAESHPNWDLRRIYADEGISATSMKNRDEFNEMIGACERGEYDLIVTKSVSRFARNLVDCITTIRRLKGLPNPVGVFFETDNIYTLGENNEFMLSFLATFAQEESVKKSEAMNWSLMERFKNGKLLTPALLGYDRPRDVTGRYIKYAPLEINEKEAKIVRFIFDAYLSGWSQESIASFLSDIGCLTKTGATNWNSGSIGYILTNERYCGNILTWKTFTADMFEHKHKKNNHDRDQYLYSDHHEAIIPADKFEAVQVLLENKKHRLCGGLPRLHVIDEGIFKGFVPINHHWINDDPNVYYDISNSVEKTVKVKRINKNKFSAFNLDGYQVVRSQFTQIRYEGPVMSISGEKITFNLFCMKQFDVKFVQLLLHPAERKIAIRPCHKDDVHSIRWRTNEDGIVYSKTLSCQHFLNALYGIMEWNPDYVYKIRGVWAKRHHQQIIVFNLINAVPAILVQNDENETARKRRVNACPEEWLDDFGEEFYEHTIENGFYYLASNSDWNALVQSVPAPGIEQFEFPTVADFQESVENLKRGMVENGEHIC